MGDKLQNVLDQVKSVFIDEVKALKTKLALLESEKGTLTANHDEEAKALHLKITGLECDNEALKANNDKVSAELKALNCSLNAIHDKASAEVVQLKSKIDEFKASNESLEKHGVTLEKQNVLLYDTLKQKDKILATLQIKNQQLVEDTRKFEANVKAIEDAANTILSQSKAMSSSWKKRPYSADLLAGPTSGPAILKNDKADNSEEHAARAKAAVHKTHIAGTKIEPYSGIMMTRRISRASSTAAAGANITLTPKEISRSLSSAANGAFMCTQKDCKQKFNTKSNLQYHLRNSH